MRRSFLTPATEFTKLQFPLNFLFVLGGIVVEPLAFTALKFY